ncbi:MAG: 16S rRNA (cytidine(1402)-2'-O)-methyltransferase [Rhodanobacteraceae bacterium]|nr:16S rRNA (cytidine(1402)-2'-O)-methyltransferase [Rhodanobacteraceae bacterium]MBK7044607.1 16S rRNA (cytidine(1402)-2'-O)-methyltransferase [Rhodanobacteraceae bacterium]MBP9155072.1 16S rRNA (cytidine(1402)-2'-O)-methyltransferase [Xanthomonadales bacterium]HQW81349.1 16S rRNA (cytidine(1402)-2'-O)-methyltransferase [Pseudomonadota bacterium]
MSSNAPREPGCLYVVATPIGHRDDLSARAIATLKRADRIACEDTRHSAPLLASIGAAAPTVALHEHNEAQAATKLVERMCAGEHIALISDAGTPLVSDPGYRLVQAAIAAGLRVVPIPGASAPIAALSVSGLASDHFSFEGFLPTKSGARREVFAALVDATRTLIFFEAKHRIVDSLADAVSVFGGERRAAIGRELTKLHETILRGTLAELQARVDADPEQRLGEFVLMVAGAERTEVEARRVTDAIVLAQRLATEMSASRAAKLAAEISGTSKNMLYRALTDL